jgi:hypothetical protein
MKDSYVGNGMYLTKDDVSGAINELHAEYGRSKKMSRKDMRNLVLSNTREPGTALGWGDGILKTVEQLSNGYAPRAGQSSTQQMIDEYVASYPPDRVYLTAPAGNAEIPSESEQAGMLSGDDAAFEIARITMAHNAPRMQFDLNKAVSDTSPKTSSVRLSQSQRLHDEEVKLTSDAAEDEVLRLCAKHGIGTKAVSVATGKKQRHADSEIARLSAENSKYFVGLATDYSGDDSIDQQVSFKRLDGAPVCRGCGHEVTGRYCGDCGLKLPDLTLDDERGVGHQRPSKAGRQIAGHVNVAAEVERLSKLAGADSSGGSTTLRPLSRAAQAAGRAASRPGHTGGR